VSKSLDQKVKESQALTRFGHCLFELRSDRGQSLRDVAKELDISANYLSELERGSEFVDEMINFIDRFITELESE
jgi:transcriptional regulator with XRE-family HTH domain